jgi:hypothetical protein
LAAPVVVVVVVVVVLVVSPLQPMVLLTTKPQKSAIKRSFFILNDPFR